MRACRAGGRSTSAALRAARAASPGARRYAQGAWVLFQANMGRQAKLFLRNRAFLVIRM